MRSWISSTVKLDRGGLAKEYSPWAVVFLSPQDRFGGALGLVRDHDTIMIMIMIVRVALDRVWGTAAAATGRAARGSGTWTYLTILTVLTIETCLNDVSSVCLRIGVNASRTAEILLAAKGDKIARRADSRLGGFDLLIKEDCAGSLAASRPDGLGCYFSARSHESGEGSPGDLWSLGAGARCNGWVIGLDLQNLAVKACAGEGGKKRGREEETGSVGAG